MEQYINKSALIAEIERKLDELYKLLPNASKIENGTITISEASNTGKYTALESFRNYIDTIEVKEVDINNEISQFIDAYFEKATIGHKLSLKRVAKYFFELGLKTQKIE